MKDDMYLTKDKQVDPEMARTRRKRMQSDLKRASSQIDECDALSEKKIIDKLTTPDHHYTT